LVSENGDTRAREPRYGEPYALNGQRQIVNPGSIGQPRDQNPNAAYAMLDTETGVFEHRRIPYDIPDVQKRMRAAGLPERLVTRLEHGW
jgi:diadenosine tetraphosphatase ApaH/serine/threonine PP2A family protein phosphatase